MSVFPTLSKGQDSKFYTVKGEDVGMRSELEGGYVASRPRHTRAPRKTWTTGFTDISETDQQTMMDFWDEVRSTSLAFSWTHPITAVVYQVRFTKQFTPTYTGAGGNHRYDIPDIELEQV